MAYGALLLTAGLWASSVVTARGLLDALPPVTLAYLRWTVVLLLLAAFAWPQRKAMIATLRAHPRDYATLAALGFAPQTCLVYYGLAKSSATLLGLLNSAIPVMIVVVLALWRGRRPRRLEMMGLALSLTGVVYILVRGDLPALLRLRISPWDLLLLGAMVVWAFYTIKLTERPGTLSMPAFLFIGALLGEIFALPLLVVEIATNGVPSLPIERALGVFYLGTFPTMLAMLLFAFGVMRVGAVQAGMFTHLVPVFAALLAVVFLDERLQPFHALGFVLIAGGAILCCLRREPMLSSRPARVARERPLSAR